MKSTNLLKAELYDKIIQFGFDKEQLKLIDKFVDNVINLNDLKKLTTLENYLLSLKYGDLMNIGIVFESGLSYEIPISFYNLSPYLVVVSKSMIERYDVSKEDFLISLQKVITLKGSPMNIMDYKVSITEK